MSRCAFIAGKPSDLVRIAKLHGRAMVVMWKRANHHLYDEPYREIGQGAVACWPDGQTYQHVVVRVSSFPHSGEEQPRA